MQPPLVVLLDYGHQLQSSCFPWVYLLWWGVGYASVTTLSVGVITMVLFSIRALLGLSPWEYVLYGFLVQILLTLALLPNIRNLLAGTERRHGLPVALQKRKEASLSSSKQEQK